MGYHQIWNALPFTPKIAPPRETLKHADRVTKDEIVTLFARELQRDTSPPASSSAEPAPWVTRIWATTAG